jgi:hypothetical protein
MVSKEELKKEIDNLPANSLAEVYSYLQQKTKRQGASKTSLTIRNFNGRFDSVDVRRSAYE